MKRLYLIRHAKSSWSDPELDDFSRPLNRRGKDNCVAMSSRLARSGVHPELIVASPARRAKKTAQGIAKGIGYEKGSIRYLEELYLGSPSTYLEVLKEWFGGVDTLFLVGHNNTITELAFYLTGSPLGNVPTCGIVAVAYPAEQGFIASGGAGRLLFFDFPKNELYYQKQYPQSLPGEGL